MLSEEEIKEKINQKLKKFFEIKDSDLKENARLYEELGLDSLDAVDMMVHLEDEFDVRVNSDTFKDVRTLSELYTEIIKLVKDQVGSSNKENEASF